MVVVGITLGSSTSGLTGMTVLVLLEFSFTLGDASSSGVFLYSKVAFQGSGLTFSILVTCLTAGNLRNDDGYDYDNATKQ